MGGRGNPGDEDRRLAIMPVYDSSPYRLLANGELAAKLFAHQQPGPGKQSAAAVYVDLASTEPDATSARLTELRTMAERPMALPLRYRQRSIKQ